MVGFLALAAATGSFEFSTIAEHSSNGTLSSLIGNKLGWFDMPLGWLCAIIFSLIFFGLAIKVPMMPLHAVPNARQEHCRPLDRRSQSLRILSVIPDTRW